VQRNLYETVSLHRVDNFALSLYLSHRISKNLTLASNGRSLIRADVGQNCLDGKHYDGWWCLATTLY